jgi:hypothetical protein
MQEQSNTGNSVEEPVVRIERFWPDGRAETFDLSALPETIEVPNGASTVVSLFDQNISIRALDSLFVIDVEVAPKFDDFFMGNVPKGHRLEGVELETKWEGLDLEVKPAVVVPSPSVGLEDAQRPYVVVAVPRNPLASTQELAKLPLLVRENSEGDLETVLGSSAPWGNHAWFSEPLDGATSWEGGASCTYLGRGIWATVMWGDIDNNVSISRLVNSDDQTILDQLVKWSSDQNLGTWLALINGVAGADITAFTSEELADLKDSLAVLARRYIQVTLNVPESIKSKFDKAVSSSSNAEAVHAFLADPNYRFHSQMLDMILSSARDLSPGGVLDAADLELWLSDAENFPA